MRCYYNNIGVEKKDKVYSFLMNKLGLVTRLLQLFFLLDVSFVKYIEI